MFRPEFRSSSGHDITRETEIALRKKKSYTVIFISSPLSWPEVVQNFGNFYFFILFYFFFV